MLADALLESGDLPEQLHNLSALELADVLVKFRAMAQAVPLMAQVVGVFVEGATRDFQTFARVLAGAVPHGEDGNFPP